MEDVFIELGLVVVFASVLAWLATLCRQPIIIAYVVAGVLAGPWGLGWVSQFQLIDSISLVGITLLLFLAGLVLHPQRLVLLFRKAVVVTLAGCLANAFLVFGLFRLFGFDHWSSLYGGLALMFSSTILVVKLLPTSTLHQRHMGSVSIAVLIAQDMLAVLVILLVQGGDEADVLRWGLILPLKGVLFVIGVLVLEQWLLRRLMTQVEAYHEVLYMLCLGWCLGLAVLAGHLGLSHEVGAFIAGVALARSPLSRFLTEQLKPLRDFFLMFFFFVLGAKLDFFELQQMWVYAVVCAGLILASRPLILAKLFRLVGEQTGFSKELGWRLGQGSEFGMILAVVVERSGQITASLSQLIQLTVILTMVFSSYLVVFRYPSPLGSRPGLKQD